MLSVCLVLGSCAAVFAEGAIAAAPRLSALQDVMKRASSSQADANAMDVLRAAAEGRMPSNENALEARAAEEMVVNPRRVLGRSLEEGGDKPHRAEKMVAGSAEGVVADAAEKVVGRAENSLYRDFARNNSNIIIVGALAKRAGNANVIKAAERLIKSYAKAEKQEIKAIRKMSEAENKFMAKLDEGKGIAKAASALVRAVEEGERKVNENKNMMERRLWKFADVLLGEGKQARTKVIVRSPQEGTAVRSLEEGAIARLLEEGAAARAIGEGEENWWSRTGNDVLKDIERQPVTNTMVPIW